MDPWCTETHTKSGLVAKCLDSTVTVEQAEEQVLEWLKSFSIPPNQLVLAGNSVHVDRSFIKKYMRRLD